MTAFSIQDPITLETLQGKIEKIVRGSSPDDLISWEIAYQGSTLHGPTRYFSHLDEKKTLLKEQYFWKGKLTGYSYQYFTSGKLSSKERYSQGEKWGQQLYYFSTGILRMQLEYTQGLLDGVCLFFWENGQKKRETLFSLGKKTDKDILWDDRGHLVEDGSTPNKSL